jgi:hypothetical protein
MQLLTSIHSEDSASVVWENLCNGWKDIANSQILVLSNSSTVCNVLM